MLHRIHSLIRNIARQRGHIEWWLDAHSEFVTAVRAPAFRPDPLETPDTTQTVPATGATPTSSARPLWALSAAIVVVLLGYLAFTVPASWFPSSTVKQWGVRDMTLPRGIGGVANNEFIVSGTDASGQAYVAITTDLRARDYAAITWDAHNVPADADVHFLWRTDYAPRKIFSAPVTVEAGRLLPIVLANDAGWLGHVTGIGLAIRGTLAQPFAISGVAAKPSGAVGILQDRAREWLGFERWRGTSINTIVGGDDVQLLPLPLLLAGSIALAVRGDAAVAPVPEVDRHGRSRSRHRGHVRRVLVRARRALDVESCAPGTGDRRAVRRQGLARQAPGRRRRRAVRVRRQGARRNAGHAGAHLRRERGRLLSRARGVSSLPAQRLRRAHGPTRCRLRNA